MADAERRERKLKAQSNPEEGRASVKTLWLKLGEAIGLETVSACIMGGCSSP